MKVKIKKLHPDAVIPKYAKEGDAGLDLTAVSREYINGNTVYKTGIAVEIPKGYVGLVFPRSSNSKTSLYLTNSVGVIDSGYRGEISFKYKSVFTWVNPFKYVLRRLGFNVKLKVTFIGCKEVDHQVGDRVGQLIIIPYPQIEFTEVEELSDTERGDGGYGSTGN